MGNTPRKDAKQFTGLIHCKAGCKEALGLHFNMSLALLNLMKVEHRFHHPNNGQGFLWHHINANMQMK